MKKRKNKEIKFDDELRVKFTSGPVEDMRPKAKIVRPDCAIGTPRDFIDYFLPFNPFRFDRARVKVVSTPSKVVITIRSGEMARLGRKIMKSMQAEEKKQ